MMEGSLFIVTALLIGRLGGVEAAAHQIAINVASLCFMIPFGLAEATTVRVGHALGRGDREGLRRAAFAGLRADVRHAGGVRACCCCSATTRSPGCTPRDAAVAALAATLLLYAAAFQFPDGVQVLSAGALARAARHAPARCCWRRSRTGAWACRSAPGSGSACGWGPQGMWVGLIVGLTTAAVLLSTRFLRSSRRVPMNAGDAWPNRRHDRRRMKSLPACR